MPAAKNPKQRRALATSADPAPPRAVPIYLRLDRLILLDKVAPCGSRGDGADFVALRTLLRFLAPPRALPVART